VIAAPLMGGVEAPPRGGAQAKIGQKAQEVGPVASIHAKICR